jgi:DNA-binding NtrC family response regulator
VNKEAHLVARRLDRILVLDDDDGIRSALGRALTARGYQVVGAASAGEGEAAVLREAPDLALVDLRLPDGNGADLIPRLRSVQPGLGVVILTGHGSIDVAVTAMKRGADQFLTKPVDLDALLIVLARVLEDRRNQQRRLASRTVGSGLPPLLGVSPALLRLAGEAEHVRDTDVPVLLRGETGTGKGVLARWLHDQGPRARGPFVDINCAGFSRELLDAELFGYEAGAFTGAVKAKQGLLEVAHGGTVFLDEIGDMDPAIQARLLKVLEEKRFRRLGDVRDRAVDIRLISATHQDLSCLMKAGRFRADLYFRVCAVELHLPPLRQRLDDIEPLACSILENFTREVGRPAPALGAAALGALQEHDWPGNIRELRNVLETAALRCGNGEVRPEDLRLRAAPAGPSVETRPAAPLVTLAEVERAHIERALAATGGHVASAARVLGISTSSLYDRVRRFGLLPGGHPRGGADHTVAS